jgi:hypothetical protein
MVTFFGIATLNLQLPAGKIKRSSHLAANASLCVLPPDTYQAAGWCCENATKLAFYRLIFLWVFDVAGGLI